MTIDNNVASEPVSVSKGFPVTVGWTSAAIAVNSAMRLNPPVNITMYIEMHGPLLIDLRHNLFSWSTPLDIFPVDAVHTGLATEPADETDDLPFVDFPGQDLDDLLWEMGINSFDGKRAFWLPANERYRLTRWPNLTRHRHTVEQMQMMAVLGNTFVSATELATIAGVQLSDAQRLINALSLMRILSRTTVAPEAPVEVVAPTAATKRQSLFARLRKRLGR